MSDHIEGERLQMEVPKLSSSLSTTNINKQRQLPVPLQKALSSTTDDIKQEQCHSHRARVERIQPTDISLYEEIEQIPRNKQVDPLFFVSIHV